MEEEGELLGAPAHSISRHDDEATCLVSDDLHCITTDRMEAVAPHISNLPARPACPASPTARPPSPRTRRAATVREAPLTSPHAAQVPFPSLAATPVSHRQGRRSALSLRRAGDVGP